MKKSKKEIVVDFKGQPINRGAIVGMSGDGPWSRFQGLVVSPYSEVEGGVYSVAVFFGTEVSPSHFSFPKYEAVAIWDHENRKVLATGNLTFLLSETIWLGCPRVVFFRPEELVVQDNWKIDTLAGRVFGGNYHTIYSWPKGVTAISADYMCFRKECSTRATRVALWNVWGSVYPMHVCEGCFPETNGWCGESLPELKKPFLLADGTPASV